MEKDAISTNTDVNTQELVGQSEPSAFVERDPYEVATRSRRGRKPAPPGRQAAKRLLQAFLNGRNQRTARAYRSDLMNFQEFLQEDSLESAVLRLLRVSHGELNMLVMRYRAHLSGLGLAPATVNRRLATLRSLLKRARVLGLTPWTVEVSNLKVEAYRDTRGPGRRGFERMIEVIEANDSPRALRNRAAVRLMFDLALRRQEVVTLDIDDLDLDAGTLSVLGKGRTQKIKLTLPAQTKSALKAWLRVRGDQEGALFSNFDRAYKGRRDNNRLTGRSLYRVVRCAGKKVGIKVTPHGLRHAAITEALDLTKGDVRAVQKFSRHRDLRVLNVYDDSRADLAGAVAQLVASGKSKSRRLTKSGHALAI